MDAAEYKHIVLGLIFLKYMRAFATAWMDKAIVQELLAQLNWYQNLALLEKIKDGDARIWYARQTREHGWSHNILKHQIESRLYERQGKLTNNFSLTLPPAESDMATQIFKDPYVFDFLGTAAPRLESELKTGKLEPGYVSQLNMYMNVVDDVMCHPDDKPTIRLLLVKKKD